MLHNSSSLACPPHTVSTSTLLTNKQINEWILSACFVYCQFFFDIMIFNVRFMPRNSSWVSLKSHSIASLAWRKHRVPSTCCPFLSYFFLPTHHVHPYQHLLTLTTCPPEQKRSHPTTLTLPVLSYPVPSLTNLPRVTPPAPSNIPSPPSPWPRLS